MKIINGIKSYILPTEFRITVINNKINIINYKDIEHFDSNKVIVKSNLKSLIINGNNLVVTKLLMYEVLIEGDFVSIEFR